MNTDTNMNDEFIEDEIKFKDLRGTFGNFKSVNSFETYYIMTSINISEIDILKEASSVLKFSDIKFDEIVQRDIDHERVAQIFEEYLDKSKEKVVFFPPLLATLMITKDGKPIDKYTNILEPITTISGREYLEKNWDEKIKLSLPLSSNDNGYEINISGEMKNYINYAAKISYVENNVKLVVIDGQHRLKALHKLKEKYPTMKSINIPLCVFFPASAKDTDENITKDMRELFVTINNKGTKVSGHFITLLKDKSLSSMAVRELANNWKGMEDNYADCKLYFLEWNQRNDGRAFQVNRKQSISTVSIIAEALKNYVFDEKNGLTKSILKLDDVQHELEEGIFYKDISEENFSLNQMDVLKKQINLYIVPSLNNIFTKSLPYSEIQKTVNIALGKLKVQVTSGIIGAKDYQDNVLNEFRDIQSFDSDTRGTFDKAFKKNIEYPDYYDFFRNNIFQQAYIKVWFLLYKQFAKSPIDISEALVASMNLLCFQQEYNLFSPRRIYTQLVIYKGQKLLTNEGVKNNIASLLLSTFLNDKVSKKFVSYFSDDKGMLKSLQEYAQESFNIYLDVFKEKNISNLKSNYMYDPILTDQVKKELSELDINAKSGDKNDKDKFQQRLIEIVQKDYDESKTILSDLLV